ncbi:MAG: endonuclease/exonuclease/phosphatase family protein [Phycisphaerae bacterium]
MRTHVYRSIVWLVLCPVVALAETDVRVATYNIKLLAAETFNCGILRPKDVRTQGNRLQKLRQTIEALEADVIGLQEIHKREALALIFDPDDWWILIDDDSNGCQNLAIVVRRTLNVTDKNGDNLDADEEDFFFEDAPNTFFSQKRDLLAADIQVPGTNVEFTVMVHHAKARFGGRASTDHQREGASKLIVNLLEHQFHDRHVILLGDFNDNPDDRSMNILETGNPNAFGGEENEPGPFMFNVTEPLLMEGHVSHGLKSNDVRSGVVDTTDPESRHRNNAARGTDDNTGDTLFDQILVSPSLFGMYVADSAAVLDHPSTVDGNNSNRASDHMPVYADFIISGGEEEPSQATLRIVSLLPDPVGKDAGNEEITLTNMGDSVVSLADWRLMDRGDNEFKLHGEIPAHASRKIKMETFSMPLNQSGDTVRLLHNDMVVDEVTYRADQVQRGVPIEFMN